MKKILTMLLIMTMAVSGIACGQKEEASTETKVYEDGAVIGEGDTVFELTVVNGEGKEVTLEVHTDKYKIIIYMYYYEGYNSREIAKLLSKNESTIRTYLKDGRTLLKDNLGGQK